MIELQVDAEAAGRCLHHADALRHHFLADAITRDDGNSLLAHVHAPHVVVQNPASNAAPYRLLLSTGKSEKNSGRLPHHQADAERRQRGPSQRPSGDGLGNSSQASSAVHGGTRYKRLVTEVAAPRWINK